MRLQLKRFALASCLAAAFASFGAATARADESSGTWTGSLEGRGNYFWERSTRVIVPEGKLRLAAPNGVRVGVGYLADVISSASIASGVGNDQVKTEWRHGPIVDVGKEFDLGRSQLDATLFGTYSTESDYRSFIYGAMTSLSWNERASKASLGLSRVQDRVYSNVDASFRRPLSGFTLAPSFEQVLAPVLVLRIGYQVGYLQGYLGNPYRRAAFAGHAPERETPPDTRVRHAATAKLKWHLPSSNTSLHLLYAAYLDSWQVAAISPELRVYQQLGRDVLGRLRYRFYAQTAASFVAPATGKYPVGYMGATTNDPKLAALRTHTIGLQFDVHLSFLATTFLAFAKDSWLDVAFDRYISNSSFGSGVIGTAGGRLVF